VAAEELDGEVADAVAEALKTVRNLAGRQHPGRPPTVETVLHPDDLRCMSKVLGKVGK
jgi:hypothetical protein